MRSYALVSLPFLLLSAPAFAADAVLDSEPAPVAEIVVGDWSGFYAGVQLGGAFGDTGVFEMDRNGDGVFGDYLPAFDPAVNPAAGGFDGSFGSGFVGGLHAGYNWQAGNIVFGGLLDISYADISDRQSGFSSTPAFYHIDREIDWLATARAKLGYAFSDRFMAYATGGLAYGDVSYSFISNTPAASIVSGDGDEFGYTVGGGVEAMVTERVSLGLEYLYTNLGSNDFNVNLRGPAAFSGPGSIGYTGPGNNGSTNARGSDRDLDFHTIQLKVSYHF